MCVRVCVCVWYGAVRVMAASSHRRAVAFVSLKVIDCRHDLFANHFCLRKRGRYSN